MTITATITAIGMTAAALGGIGTPAAADIPRHDDASSVIKVTTYQGHLRGFQTINNLDYTCPAAHPWLQNVDYSPGRIMPRGVQVLESGGVGVTAFPTTGDDHRATGYTRLSATNWYPGDRHLQVIAHCTSDPRQAYN